MCLCHAPCPVATRRVVLSTWALRCYIVHLSQLKFAGCVECRSLADMLVYACNVVEVESDANALLSRVHEM